MSNQALTRQPNKAIESIGNNSSMSLTQPGKTQPKIEMLGVVVVKNSGEIEKFLSQLRLPQQQAATTNVTHITNNITINNYNGTPNQGHQGDSRDRLNQSLQATAPASRTIENESSNVGSVLSASNPTHKSQQMGQDGIGDRASSSRPANVQSRPTQEIPKAEKHSAPSATLTTPQVPSQPRQDERKKPASKNVPAAHVQEQICRKESRPHQEGIRKPTSTNIPTGHVQGQVCRKESRSQDNKHRGLFDKILHPHSHGENGSQQRANVPTSAATPPARRSNSSHPNGSRENSAVRIPQNHVNTQPPHHQNQVPSEPKRSSTSGRQVVGPSHGELQSRRQIAAVGTPQGQLAVNQRTRAAPEVAKALKAEDIRKHLKQLDDLLGGPAMKTGGHPAKLILVGKSSAEMMKLEKPKDAPEDLTAYHIDMVLDLPATDERRKCMRNEGIFKVFREFDKPEPSRPHSTEAWESFFGPNRATVLGEIAHAGERVYKTAHLQVYLMKETRALEFELIRMDNPDNDQSTRRASLSIIVALLFSRTQEHRDKTYKSWRSITSAGGSRIPDASIKDVEDLFMKRYGERGTV